MMAMLMLMLMLMVMPLLLLLASNLGRREIAFEMGK
jgi:hypothetical protein